MPDVIRLCPFCGANLNLCAPLFGCCSEGAVCEGEEGLGNSVQEPLFVGQSEPAATNAPVGRSVHWMPCIFSFGAGWGSWQSISFCCWPLYFFFFGSWSFFPGPDLTHSYPAHFSTFISTTPTLVPYLLSPTNTATLITSYPIDLVTVLTTYPTNLATLLITYPTLKTLP